jgi:ATP-binding cassette subfamily B (MDR/TAP) protein 1
MHFLQSFNDCLHTEKLYRVLFFSFMFLGLGIVNFVIRIFQVRTSLLKQSDSFLFYSIKSTAFSISGSKLTQRVRTKAFSCLLRQEVAYFDRPENNSGSVCTRLSSDALALQQMAGTRLGLICEAVAIYLFGLILGLFFSWQLTVIVLFFVVVILLVAYMDLHLKMRLDEQSALILGQASSVG